MKPFLTILVEGYAHTGGIYEACSTSILLEYKQKNYIVDPGCNKSLLLPGLSNKDLKPEDINGIFLTHYHLDHLLNIRLFPKVLIFDGSAEWEQDAEIPNYNDYWICPEFKIFPTPGHATEQFSLLVDTENLGPVCIAQDVFWWEDGKQQSDTVEDLMALVDPFANDVVALKASRETVLATGATWIVPGHGKMFRNPKAA